MFCLEGVHGIEMWQREKTSQKTQKAKGKKYFLLTKKENRSPQS